MDSADRLSGQSDRRLRSGKVMSKVVVGGVLHRRRLCAAASQGCELRVGSRLSRTFHDEEFDDPDWPGTSPHSAIFSARNTLEWASQ
jgi:hypothetical protein